MPIAILVHLPIAELCLSQFLYTFWLLNSSPACPSLSNVML